MVLGSHRFIHGLFNGCDLMMLLIYPVLYNRFPLGFVTIYRQVTFFRVLGTGLFLRDAVCMVVGYGREARCGC